MPSTRQPWFAVGPNGGTNLTCARCGQDVDLGFPSLDHHSGACPACGVESVFLTWDNTPLQIVPEAAPPELARTLRWTQENLDELEFVTVLSSLAEVGALVREAQPARSAIL